MKKYFAITVAVCTSGCVSYYDPMLRTDKSGAVIEAATLIDSSKRVDGTRVQLFYVSKVDGKEIENALNATSKFNNGKGIAVQPIAPHRQVPANMALALEICGETYNGAPILDLFRADQKRCETFSRSFDPNKNYYVTGHIDQKVAVEIVDVAPVNSDEESVIWDGKY